MKIAVVQTGSWGDNCNSTLMFRPIKKHFNNVTLDVFTSSKYISAFNNNPHIDKIIQFPASSKQEALELIYSIKPVGYDLVINSHPMVNKTWSSRINPNLGENLILAWVNALEDNNIPYELPLTTDLCLTDHENGLVSNFMNSLPKEKKIVLMECEGESGQSPWNNDWTTKVINTLIEKGYLVLVSCVNQHKEIKQMQVETGNCVIWIGGASIRVVAGIFDHCDAFISVSSGLANACNTRQRRPIAKWVEVVNSITCSTNIVGTNDKTFWHSPDKDAFCDYVHQSF